MLRFLKRQTLLALLLLLSATNIQAQEFIGCRTESGWAETPKLRKTFTVKKSELKRYDFQTLTFHISITSLGYHELYINGVRVGDRVLQPAVSQLDKRALEVSYDITDLVREGDNEVMLWLGQGWGRIYGTPAVAKAALMSEVTDKECGLIDYVVWTDSTWQASPSPYSYTGSWQPVQFGGERYDARIREHWRPASVYDASGITVRQQEFKGNRIVDIIKLKNSEKEPDGSVLLDFGRVVTGWLVVAFDSMAANQQASMEYLDHRGAKPPHTETDIYISDGSGKDIFRNRFHTHSFRYVRVKGATVKSANAQQISAVDPFGGAHFECSDPRLNAIHDMVKYTLSCLTFSGYMVDCPHIERMGYGGDGNSSTNTLQTLWDVRDTYRQWMQAWHVALDSTGDLPYVAPAFRTGGGPYWQGFIVKAPWRTYVNYGDRSLIDLYYNDMCRWMDYIERHSEDGILQPWGDTERHSWFLADWLAPDGVDIGGESVLHASSCFIAECLSNMEQMAIMTGHPADAERFALRRQKVVEAIHRHFYHPETHTYANGTPLDMAYALLMGILPDSATTTAVKAQLIKDIHSRYRDHVAFGLMGTPIFTEWCIRNRQTDLMATLLRQPDYPGYLRMMEAERAESGERKAENNATQDGDSPLSAFRFPFSVWESWGCGLPGKEDRSRVHNCYNGIGTWFYQALAGIRPNPEEPGYRHFYVDPQPCEGVEWLRAVKPTPFGDIEIEIRSGELHLSVPEGTTATVFPGTTKQQTLSAGQHTIALNDKSRTPDFGTGGPSLDYRILRTLQQKRTPAMDRAMQWTSNTLVLAPAVPVSLAVAGWAGGDDRLKFSATSTGLSFIIAFGITEGLKNAVRRPRPYLAYPDDLVALHPVRGYSFPSGHTSLSFAVATSLTLAHPRWYVAVPSMLWATGVGFSRLYLGVHNPSDVLVGALVGSASAVLSHYITKRIYKDTPLPTVKAVTIPVVIRF